jgi:hypothetical protein
LSIFITGIRYPTNDRIEMRPVFGFELSGYFCFTLTFRITLSEALLSVGTALWNKKVKTLTFLTFQEQIRRLIQLLILKVLYKTGVLKPYVVSTL